MRKLLICFVLGLMAVNCMAQDENGRNKERNIKTTDLYLYGEATAGTAKEATTLAKKILISKIFDFEPALINNSDQIEKKIENSDQFLSMERGVKFRSIAFCPKSDIQNLVKDAPKNESKDQVSKREEVKENKRFEEKQDVTVVGLPLEKVDLQPDVPPAINEEAKENPKAKTESIVHQVANSQNVDSISSVRSDFLNGKELLKYIISIDDAHKLAKLFDAQKQNGMLIYGGKMSISFPDKCYIVVYCRDGAVKAFLDKGSSSRKNLITGEIQSLDMYKENPFIWFQLMN